MRDRCTLIERRSLLQRAEETLRREHALAGSLRALAARSPGTPKWFRMEKVPGRVPTADLTLQHTIEAVVYVSRCSGCLFLCKPSTADLVKIACSSCLQLGEISNGVLLNAIRGCCSLSGAPVSMAGSDRQPRRRVPSGCVRDAREARQSPFVIGAATSPSCRLSSREYMSDKNGRRAVIPLATAQDAVRWTCAKPPRNSVLASCHGNCPARRTLSPLMCSLLRGWRCGIALDHGPFGAPPRLPTPVPSRLTTTRSGARSPLPCNARFHNSEQYWHRDVRIAIPIVRG